MLADAVLDAVLVLLLLGVLEGVLVCVGVGLSLPCVRVALLEGVCDAVWDGDAVWLGVTCRGWEGQRRQEQQRMIQEQLALHVLRLNQAPSSSGHAPWGCGWQ